MPATRRRRIVRRAVMALAGIVLLASGYVSTYFGMYWLWMNGSITSTTRDALNRTIYAPIVSYVHSGHPGSDIVTSWQKEMAVQAEMRALDAMNAKVLEHRETALKARRAEKPKR